MPLFFIEMGQGIIANGALRVRTSAPDVRADMDTWMAVLRPTAVTLIFSPLIGMMGTSNADRQNLQHWVQQNGVVPATTNAVAAGMELTPAGLAAGNIANLSPGFGNGPVIQLHTRDAGTYLDNGRYTLVGENREG